MKKDKLKKIIRNIILEDYPNYLKLKVSWKNSSWYDCGKSGFDWINVLYSKYDVYSIEANANEEAKDIYFDVYYAKDLDFEGDLNYGHNIHLGYYDRVKLSKQRIIREYNLQQLI